MSSAQPRAIIFGIEKFGAVKLAEILVENDISVTGVGEYTEGLSEIKGIEVKGALEEITEEADYVFDFIGSENLWNFEKTINAKLTIVGINNSVKKNLLPDKDKNWRMVDAHGVLGPGMEGEEIKYLLSAVELAVKNKNLMLPPRKQKLRLLTLNDVREAAMRATFLSGTTGEIFNLWGEVIDSEELAKILIDEAKMTRYKVVESAEVGGIPGEEMESEWRRLRWRPTGTVKQAMTETLQYYFAKADEESRRKKEDTGSKKQDLRIEQKKELEQEKREAAARLFAVEVESDYVPTERDYAEVKKETEKYEVEEKSEETETQPGFAESYAEVKEELMEIAPIVVKNSNMRPVHEIVEEESPVIPVKQIQENPSVLRAAPLDRGAEKISDVRPQMSQKKKVRRKLNINLPWKYIGAAAVAATAVWLTAVVLSNYVIVRNVLSLKKLIDQRKYAQAAAVTESTRKSVRQKEAEVAGWGLNRTTWGRRYQDLLKVADDGLSLSENAITISQDAEMINDGIFKDKDIEWDKELTQLREEVGEAEANLGLVAARLQGDWSWVPNRWRGSLTEIKTQLGETKEMLSEADKALEILPEMIGTDGKRREYLVLLQNESELRPGGGFIGSYGILSFEGGKLMNFDISDIYEADGQLKGHVEPPQPIRDYMGQAAWYMRDANWQADFGASSKDIQWFLEKETGRKVDGVIGVDLAVAKGILNVVGEVYVPDFKEKINKNNLYEQAEFYSETNSFPGSQQKASFLGGLGKQLFENIKGLSSEERLNMAKTILDLLDRNEIQLQFNDKGAATTAASLGWTGNIYDGKCAVERCFADYLYIVEANLGVNKANYFLYRSVEQNIEITQRSISRVVRISYENTAKNQAWPGGDYKNYLRLYIPQSANLAEVSVSEGSNNAVKTIITGDNLKVNTVNGKKEVGTLITVPVGQKRIVEIRYTDQIDLSDKDKFSYLNYIQKQPGFGDTGLVTLITMPKDWQVNQVEPEASLMGDKLLFNQKLDRDIKMGVEIVK